MAGLQGGISTGIQTANQEGAHCMRNGRGYFSQVVHSRQALFVLKSGEIELHHRIERYGSQLVLARLEVVMQFAT